MWQHSGTMCEKGGNEISKHINDIIYGWPLGVKKTSLLWTTIAISLCNTFPLMLQLKNGHGEG